MTLENILTIVGMVISFLVFFVSWMLWLKTKIVRLEDRMKVIEEKKVVLEKIESEISGIKDDIHGIQLANTKYFTLLETNQDALLAMTESIKRIHDRMDKILESK